MGFLDFLGNIFVSVFVVYLSFTNSLASHIEKLLPHEPTPAPTVVTQVQDTLHNELRMLPNAESGSQDTSISKILLEHREFQRAATIASTRTEASTTEVETGFPLDKTIRDALVNIYCQYKTDTYIRTTTGTGVLINPKGIILTNAHVAQFLLLKDADKAVADVECVIRSGDPAVAKYTAELLYISPTWIYENANLITEESPRGTGERDYSLLYIEKSIDDTPLPTRFPSIPVDTALLPHSTAGISVMTAGYPAEALFRGGVDAKLIPVIASTTIGSLYTFGSRYADIFSVSESPVGQQGASGGPIVTTDTHDVIGIIVTKGDEATEGANSLRAITLSYIDRTIIEETGFSLAQNMQGDVAYRGNIFKKVMIPFLAGLLEEQLVSGL